MCEKVDGRLWFMICRGRNSPLNLLNTCFRNKVANTLMLYAHISYVCLYFKLVCFCFKQCHERLCPWPVWCSHLAAPEQHCAATPLLVAVVGYLLNDGGCSWTHIIAWLHLYQIITLLSSLSYYFCNKLAFCEQL